MDPPEKVIFVKGSLGSFLIRSCSVTINGDVVNRFYTDPFYRFVDIVEEGYTIFFTGAYVQFDGTPDEFTELRRRLLEHFKDNPRVLEKIKEGDLQRDMLKK